jgi:hypothetical protein
LIATSDHQQPRCKYIRAQTESRQLASRHSTQSNGKEDFAILSATAQSPTIGLKIRMTATQDNANNISLSTGSTYALRNALPRQLLAAASARFGSTPMK